MWPLLSVFPALQPISPHFARIRAKTNMARPITMRFLSTFTRDAWLMGKKNRKDLLASDIHPWPKTLVFINERSTKEERRRLAEAKALGKTHNCSYVWMKRGVVFVKVNDNSRPFKYTSPQQFPQMVQLGLQTDSNNSHAPGNLFYAAALLFFQAIG